MFSQADRVVLVASAFEPAAERIARDALEAGARVAAAVTRPWQVDKLRESLGGGDRLLVGHVGPRDAQAAAGFVKGATDALGVISEFACAAVLLRKRDEQREPAGDLEELLEANLYPGATLARALLPRLRGRHQGLMRFCMPPLLPHEWSATTNASLGAMMAFSQVLDVDAEHIEVIVEMPPYEPEIKPL